jgi:hypothetical protein
MKLSAPYKCNYCLNIKGETNHWWLRDATLKIFALLRWSDAGDPDAENDKGEPQYEHICSESCAVKALAKWMATTPARQFGELPGGN